MRPVLFLDVDGVLNPGFGNGSWLKRHRDPDWTQEHVTVEGQRYRLRLNRAHGPKLLAVAEITGCELVWATTWGQYANEHIGPVVGLPPLPVVPVGSRVSRLKFGPAVQWAGGRPFAWLDDDPDITGRCDAHGGAGIWVDPASGLQDHHLERAREVLQEMTREETGDGQAAG